MFLILQMFNIFIETKRQWCKLADVEIRLVQYPPSLPRLLSMTFAQTWALIAIQINCHYDDLFLWVPINVKMWEE